MTSQRSSKNRWNYDNGVEFIYDNSDSWQSTSKNHREIMIIVWCFQNVSQNCRALKGCHFEQPAIHVPFINACRESQRALLQMTGIYETILNKANSNVFVYTSICLKSKPLKSIVTLTSCGLCFPLGNYSTATFINPWQHANAEFQWTQVDIKKKNIYWSSKWERHSEARSSP